MHDLRQSSETVNAKADAVAALLDDGYLRIYDGTRPATPDDPVTTQTLLAELRFGSPAFSDAVDGTITANAITPVGRALETGAASWYRTLKADGASPVHDGTVDSVDSDLVIDNVNIQSNIRVTVSDLTFTELGANDGQAGGGD